KHAVPAAVQVRPFTLVVDQAALRPALHRRVAEAEDARHAGVDVPAHRLDRPRAVPSVAVQHRRVHAQPAMLSPRGPRERTSGPTTPGSVPAGARAPAAAQAPAGRMRPQPAAVGAPRSCTGPVAASGETPTACAAATRTGTPAGTAAPPSRTACTGPAGG